MKKTALLLAIVMFTLSLASCGNLKSDALTLTKMNTVMNVTVFSTSKGSNKEFLGKVSECIDKYDKSLDANKNDSEVSRINNGEKEIKVSSETAYLLKKAIKAAKITDGAFDITVMPLLKLWGFDNGKYGVPKKTDIEKALKLVDYKNISVKGNNFTKSNNTEIALGGIAKGFLGDEILKIAETYGASAIVSLGGNIVLCGEKGKNERWTVGIKNPDSSQNLACTFKSGGNKSVVTSGGYERYFEYGGKTYHHIVDTKTGYPAKTDLKSVTVIGSDGTFCDAFSTALFVMGKEKATDFAKKHSDFEFIFITDNNEILYTDGIENIAVKDNSFTLKSIQK